MPLPAVLDSPEFDFTFPGAFDCILNYTSGALAPGRILYRKTQTSPRLEDGWANLRYKSWIT